MLKMARLENLQQRYSFNIGHSQVLCWITNGPQNSCGLKSPSLTVCHLVCANLIDKLFDNIHPQITTSTDILILRALCGVLLHI